MVIEPVRRTSIVERFTSLPPDLDVMLVVNVLIWAFVFSRL